MGMAGIPRNLWVWAETFRENASQSYMVTTRMQLLSQGNLVGLVLPTMVDR